ncbi:5852_t:CDS:1, partial [Funneliformis mosseae]
RNSLSAIDASYEDPSIEALLRREIVRYDQKKKRQLTNSLYIYSMETGTQTGTTDFSDKVDKATQTEDINFLAKIEQANILLM